jgi:malonyl-CoA decarboxylase
MTPETPKLMNAPSFIKRLIRSVASPGKQGGGEHQSAHAIELCRALLSERGEVSGAALAREALAAYNGLSDAAIPVFFDQLATEFSPDPQQLDRACEDYRAGPSADALAQLQRAVEAPRQELFRRLNMGGGTATLVAMRKQLLSKLKTHPGWKSIDRDLAHLFGSWFNRGFLTLQQIDWRTPAIVLEKLIQYEAVHEISGWKDLHRRLEADRRCFAFFHPALPDEPLIFIEVALTQGMSGAVQPLLDLDSPVIDPDIADTAIFYSITNCQEGLRGISFGNLLIKQVARLLGREFPRIKTFATLSPIPGFRRWVSRIAVELEASADGRAALDEIARCDEPGWCKDGAAAEAAQKIIMPLCAYYLIHARQDIEPADPVARFHLGNGARLERLNWLADTSKRGVQRSAGLMVNYLYRLDKVEDNHEVYVREHRVVASHTLRKLARECPLIKLSVKQ